MRSHPRLFACTCFMMAAALLLGSKTALAQKPSTDAVRAAGLRLGDPIRQDRMTIYPVVSMKPRQADPYITLQEGLASGMVKVKEMGAGAENGPAVDQLDISDLFGAVQSNQASAGNQVNRVRVKNDGDKPLYLMPGEIILGGDQDRVIAEEYVIKPDGKPIAVQVFCVEHGRWGNRSQRDNVQNLAAVQMNIQRASPSASISEQAAKADNDEFIASANVGNKSVRIAVQQHAKQSIVWNEVAKLNKKSGAMSGSGTYTANFTDKEANQKLQPYRNALRDSVTKVSNIVGVVVEINGRPEAADVFATTPLFKKLWPRLLEGYAVDAATSAPVTAADARKQTRKSPKGNGELHTSSARDFLVSVLSEQKSSGAGGAHGRSKKVIAMASEQSYVDAYSASVPIHVAGYSSDGDVAAPLAEESFIPASPRQR